MNIRNFVSNDHIMSTNEIMQTQSVAIQAYMIENEQLQKELKEVYDKLTNKDKQIDQLTNNWNELEEWLKSYIELIANPDTIEEQTLENLKEVLDKMKEIKEGNNEYRSTKKSK